MTTKELIIVLSKFDQNSEPFVFNPNTGSVDLISHISENAGDPQINLDKDDE